MPPTTNNKVDAKPSTDLGDAAKEYLLNLEKKVRNLEKRKGRIEQNQEKAKKGVKLEKEQEDSLQQYGQVIHSLEFAQELHKQFQQINQEHEKMARKQVKREKAERQLMEVKRISEILQLQALLDIMAEDKVREDFKSGKHGAVILTEDNLIQLDELYEAISPSRENSGDKYPQLLTSAAEHLFNYLEGKDRQVVGTTYKELRELITLINECGYLEKIQQLEAVDIVAEPTQETEAVVADTTDEPVSDQIISSKQQEQTFDTQVQPVDITGPTNTAQPQRDLPPQTLNTVEQDVFFAPSSLSGQVDKDSNFTQAHHTDTPQVSSYPSFTNGPFQFMQASYVMPESTAPAIVDPAVILAQPAVNSGLQFVSQRYDAQPLVTSQMQQLQIQPQQQHQISSAVDLTYQPQSSASQQSQQPPLIAQEYNSQKYAQMASGLAVSTSVPQHSAGSVAETQILTSAADFSNKPIPIREFVPSNSVDYQQINNEFSGGANLSHGGFQGGPVESSGNEGSSTGSLGENPMKSGYNGRGRSANTNSSHRGRGGNYQGYPANNSYRQDSFEGTYNNSYNKSGYSSGAHQKRGGMNSVSSTGEGGYTRGGNAGRSGMHGGVTRGGNSGPRGASRGGVRWPLTTQ